MDINALCAIPLSLLMSNIATPHSFCIASTIDVRVSNMISMCSVYNKMNRLICFLSGVLGATPVEIEHHLEMGRKLLAAGQLAEALSHYHSAVGRHYVLLEH